MAQTWEAGNAINSTWRAPLYKPPEDEHRAQARAPGLLPLLDSMAFSSLSSVSRSMQKLETPLQTLMLQSESCYRPSGRIREAVNALEATLPSLEAAVIQAEERQWREELARSWLMDIKDVACDAEDLLEQLDLNLAMLCPSDSSTRPQTSTSSFIWEDEVCDSLTSLACRIEEIGSRFREILEQIDTALQLKEGEIGQGWLESGVRPLRDEFVKQTEVFGRGEDRKNVIELLLSDSPIVALVGAGGVGKSTLARLVLDEPRVCEHYPRRGWIRMSNDFDALTLKREIMEALTNWAWRVEFAGKGEWIFQQPNYLKNYIKRELGAERFLIVLDDFCEENLDLWETITLQLSHGHVGSRILLVTRSERVVSVLENTPMAIYRVDNLSEDNSWQLFQTLAFESHLSNPDPDLVEVGKEIVQKCKGLPLSIKMLGVLLQSETRSEMWVSILNSRLWEIDEKENGILPALLISYCFLPRRLQPCMEYCSLFPKDFLYRKEKLVRLWMAQGFVPPREGKLLEEIGSEYFDELLRRGFFLKWYAGDHTFALNPLVHDLAEHVSGKQCCKQKNMNFSCISNSTRHVSFSTPDTLTDVSLELECESGRLRTILILIKSVNSAYKRMSWYDFRYDILHLSFSGSMFLNLNCLRTLDFSDTDIEALPDSICNLKHLRFLGLNNNRIRWLPEQLCHLCNLQTLELRNCHLISLPKSIAYLTNLHHLDLLHGNERIHLHHGIGKLTNLQTLSVFHTGKDAEHYVIKELGNLRNLRGELCVAGLHNLDDAADAKEAGLIHKEHLKKLTLQWCYPNDDCYRRGVAPRSTGSTCINCKNHEAIEEQQSTEEAPGSWTSNAEETADPQPSNSSDDADDTWFFDFDIDIDAVPEKPKRTREDMLTSQRKIRESQQMMLENLRPHGNLEELEVMNYHGSELSSWMGDPAFSKLVSVRLNCCFQCEILPPLGQLPLLRHLLIRHLPRVKRVGREFCGIGHGSGFRAFPSLETAEFDGLYEWEEWSGEVQAGEFARLREMRFCGCMRLKRIPAQLKRWL